MLVTAILTPAAEGGSTALNPETGSVIEGEMIDAAAGKPREAVGLYLEEVPLRLAGAPLVTIFAIGRHA